MAEELGGIIIRLSTNADSFVRELNQIEQKMKAFADLGSKLQKTGLALSTMGVAVVASFGLMFKSFTNDADALNKMSQKTGIAVGSLQELRYAADLGGSSLESVVVATKFLSRAITEAKDGTQQYVDSFKNLGIRIEEIKNLSPEEQFYKIAGAIADIKNPTEKTARTLELFGRAGTELIPMLKNGSVGLKAMAEEFRKYGTVIDTVTAQAAEDFNDTLERTQATLKAAFTIISVQMLPIMQSLATSLSETVLNIKNFISNNKELVTTLTKVVVSVGIIVTAFGGLLTVVGTLLTLAPTIATSWAIIMGPIGWVIGGIVALSVTVTTLYKNWDWVTLQMQKAWVLFVDVVLASTITMLEALKSIPFISKSVNNAIQELNKQRYDNSKNILDKITAYEIEKSKQTIENKKKENEEERNKQDELSAVVLEAGRKRQEIVVKREMETLATIAENARKAVDARISYEKSQFDKYSVEQKQKILLDEKQIISERLTLEKGLTEQYFILMQQKYENEKQLSDLANADMAIGFDNAMSELVNRTTNYKDVIVGIYDNMQSGIASSFNTLFTDLSNGFANFGAFAASVGNAIKGALINAFAQIAAEWLMQHVIMAAASLVWKSTEVASSAAVGASRAAAASAWSLWAAIPIGLAIGAAIMAMAGAFAEGGIVGGSSFSGDKMLAKVNSGEMILNDQQQSNLWKLANGTGQSNKNVQIEQNFAIKSGNNIEELVQAIRRGTSEALEFAGLTYNVGIKQANVVV